MEAKSTSIATEQIESTAGEKCQMEQVDQVSGDVVLVTAEGVRRVPIPSNDPNDPLNFSKWRKAGAVITCCWFSIFSLLSLSGIGTFMNSLFGLYSPTQSPEDIIGLSTYPTMVMAFGCLALLPLAFVYGRRPVFLLAVIVAFICLLTAGASKSFTAHFTSRIFVGLATGATESLLPLILSDITFLDERSFFFALYWSTQNCVNAGLLISLSYLTAAAGWRWYYWLFAITLGVSTLLVIFALPETKYFRSPRSLNGQVVFTDEFGTTHILSDAEAKQRFGNIQENVALENSKKKSYWQELKPWSDVTPNGLKVMIGAYGKILRSATSPAVIFALLLSSISLGIGIAVTLVYSTILEVEYKWSAKSVGLFNAGTIPACFAAMFYAGYCADKINIWLARRNNGVHKSEHHLIHLIIPCIAGIVGLVAIAICASDAQKYSAWGLVIGWAIYQFSFTAIIITTTTFAAEVIPENPGAAMVVVVGGKNLVSFGAAQGIVPMVHAYSYLTAFMILLGIFVGISLLGIPIYFLNRRWRIATSRRKA